MTFPANPVKLPDCQMNWEALAKNLGGVKSFGALKNVYGPFDGGVSVGMAQNVEATFTFNHNLNIKGTQVVAGFLYDGFFSGAFGWRASTAANTLQIIIHNLRSTSGGADSAGWRGVIFEF